MKYYMELFLTALLLALMYEKPVPLVRFSNSTLGKVILVLSVLTIAHTCGLTSGLLSAIIIIALRHTWREGFEDKNNKSAGLQNALKGLAANKALLSPPLKKPLKKPVKQRLTSEAGKTNKQCNTNLDCSKVQTCKDGACVSITDRVGLDRKIKSTAELNTISSTKQANGQTN
jgi:hypothetical protein